LHEKEVKQNKKITYGPGDVSDVSWALVPASFVAAAADRR
jgi:hypothetical protein